MSGVKPGLITPFGNWSRPISAVVCRDWVITWMPLSLGRTILMVTPSKTPYPAKLGLRGGLL